MPVPLVGSIDSPAAKAHFAGVNKKPSKLAESASSYAAKKPAKAAAKPADDAEFQRITGKLLKERKDLLQKLAQ